MKKVLSILLVVFVVACWFLPQAALADEGPRGKGGKHGYGSDGELVQMEDFRGEKGAARGEGVLLPDQSLEELGMFQLTQAQSEAQHPMFSPDGSKIAYMYDDGGDKEIHVMELDFSSGTPVVVNDYPVTDAEVQCAHLEGWSADGTKILFRSYEKVTAARNNLWLTNADGSGVEQLTFVDLDWACFGGPTLYQASFSPDGSKIVYAMTYNDDVDGRTGKDIYVMNADGTGAVQLTDTYRECELSPRWSPDGSQILYKKCDYSNTADLWVMNANGSNPQVVVAEVNAQIFDWSPDGEWIVYENKDDTNPTGYYRDVYKVRPDGSQNTRLTPSDDYCEHTALWGPDGTILYRSDELEVTGETDFSSTWVMRPDGSDKTMINPWGGMWHDWSPDGQWIAFQTCEPPELEGDAQIFIMGNPLNAAPAPTGPAAIPTISQWGAIGMIVALAGCAVWMLRKRRNLPSQ